ncbi:transcriptional regulator [Microbacterium sp. B35-04]|uniref:TetR/AcrR family transcriptional regulator n=1 Tax=unclassified Microbacterium TaxID=2609290 RepID=UPI0013D3E2CB|nr:MULTISPECIES: TetR/AcrR family transcriptional regulator [unclassified Microbacterium]KAF2414036.1 transcriptional regulator [Microbacterium sp. B35-04]KAF2416761.1 transcriptional regulator [Microbacterium sp. B35-30]
MTVVEASSGTAVRRGPGRPRDADLDAQILAGALALIDEGATVTVSLLVAQSGVSRAAIYRRWPSLTALVAAALDVGRTVPPDIPLTGDLRDAVSGSLFGGQRVSVVGYSEERFRQRIRLAMADRDLQQAYWDSHVSRRRASLERALQAGVERGILRKGLDPATCFDLLAGVVYYQLVVRGDTLSDPVVWKRCQDAFDIAWRGMVAETG